MKVIKKASGSKTLKMSKNEWFRLGRKAGWVRKAQSGYSFDDADDYGDDLALDDGFNTDDIDTFRWETEIDFGENIAIPVTIVYDYDPADPIIAVDISEILDESGNDIFHDVITVDPEFLGKYREALIEHAEMDNTPDYIDPRAENIVDEDDVLPGFHSNYQFTSPKSRME